MRMEILNGKDVLLLAPHFFGYEAKIKSYIEGEGAHVDYHTCNFNSLARLVQGLLTIIHIPSSRMVRHFENKIYNKYVNSRYDYIIVICGASITSYLTKKIRNNNLNDGGKMFLYYWDSMKRLKDDRKRWDDFDSIYTFDPVDYEENKQRLNFLPLFYCEDYWGNRDNKKTIDAMTIGTFRLDRLEFVRTIIENNPTILFYSYLYISKWVFLIHKIFRKKYYNVKFSELKYKKLSFNEVMDLYNKSCAVVDIPAVLQNGLTIRTFETLAMHKKLITSNSTIANYDFYSPDDIYIIKDDYKLPEKEWFIKPFSIPDSVIKEYSLETWISRLFGLR